MSQRKKNLYGVFGLIIGICIGALWRNYRTLEIVSLCNAMNGLSQRTSSEIIGLKPTDTLTNSQSNLLFVGVMTAKEFLDGRATAVYDTWGKNVPGKMAFFSSEDSRSKRKILTSFSKDNLMIADYF
jgi:chondroitin sulfate synthase